jgi:hypothetical protein
VGRVQIEKRVRRVGIFVGRATKAGFVQIKFLRPVVSALSFAFGISALSLLLGVLGGSVALVVMVVVVCVSGVMLTGAYRLWDDLQGEQERIAKSGSFASAVTRIEPPNDPRPDLITFDVVRADPDREINIESTQGGGEPYAVRFIRQNQRVDRNQVPHWVRWGPPWHRRRLLVKGFTATTLVVEPEDEILGEIKIEVYRLT